MRGTQQAAKKHDVSVVLCGQAGQGVQTVEHLVTHPESRRLPRLHEGTCPACGVAPNSTTSSATSVAAAVNPWIFSCLNRRVCLELSPETVLVGERGGRRR